MSAAGTEKATAKVLTDVRLLVLSFGTFAVGTGTWLVSGIVGDVARGLSVFVGAAGQLLTVFAVAYALLSPVLVAATGAVARRRLLAATLSIFVIANLLGALAPSYPILIASRVLGVFGAAVFTPVAVGVASELVPEEKRGQALSVVMGGFTLAWVVGVPLGTLLGDAFGWRATFAMVAVLAEFKRNLRTRNANECPEIAEGSCVGCRTIRRSSSQEPLQLGLD